MFILLYNLLICLCSVELRSPDSRCEGVYFALQLVDLLLCSPDSRCEDVYSALQLVDLLVFTRLRV